MNRVVLLSRLTCTQGLKYFSSLMDGNGRFDQNDQKKRKSISRALWHWNNLLNLQCTLNVRLKVPKRGGWEVVLIFMIGVKGPQMLIWQQGKPQY